MDRFDLLKDTSRRRLLIQAAAATVLGAILGWPLYSKTDQPPKPIRIREDHYHQYWLDVRYEGRNGLRTASRTLIDTGDGASISMSYEVADAIGITDKLIFSAPRITGGGTSYYAEAVVKQIDFGITLTLVPVEVAKKGVMPLCTIGAKVLADHFTVTAADGWMTLTPKQVSADAAN